MAVDATQATRSGVGRCCGRSVPPVFEVVAVIGVHGSQFSNSCFHVVASRQVHRRVMVDHLEVGLHDASLGGALGQELVGSRPLRPADPGRVRRALPTWCSGSRRSGSPQRRSGRSVHPLRFAPEGSALCPSFANSMGRLSTSPTKSAPVAAARDSNLASPGVVFATLRGWRSGRSWSPTIASPGSARSITPRRL